MKPLAFVAALILAPTLGAGDESIFSDQVAPILESHCVRCHAGKLAKGGLDLTTETGLRTGGNDGPVIVPGKPGESRLVELISGDKPKMPRGSPPLSTKQIASIQKWIQEGATWEKGLVLKEKKSNGETWWSLRPLRRPAIPSVKERDWVRNPVDAFILNKLEEKGLRPNSEADRPTLMRRLTYDLHGLPPTPEEIDAFVADRRPDAYERLVDRLLASPRYGERRARHWLDVVRFGESQGFERDKLRDHAWRYRDYVINSFNDDKPYDRFLREQVAGDVLDPGNPEGVIATGFLVCGPWDEVGATQQGLTMRRRAREEELEDMISAVGQTFLGLTINCARCHDHKFDPIPQRDYYRLKAALEGVRPGDRSILMPDQLKARASSLTRFNEKIARLEKELSALERVGRDKVLPVRFPPAAPQKASQPIARWTFEGDARDSIGTMHGTLMEGAKVANGRLLLDGKGALVRTAPLSRDLKEKTIEAWVSPANLTQRGGGVMSIQSKDGVLFDAIVFGEREPKKWIAGSNGFVRTQDLNGASETAEGNELVHIAITYQADHSIQVHRNGMTYGNSYKPAAMSQSFLKNEAHVLFGLRHTGAGNGFFAGAIEEARLYDRAMTAEEVAASFRFGPPVASLEEILRALTEEQRRQWLALAAQLNQQKAHLQSISVMALTYAVNPSQPEPTHVLARGDVEKKKELVAAGGLSAIQKPAPEFGLLPDADEGRRRVKLAEWLTHPDNPLTPRIMVNRVWHYHFGKGIVGTPNDFGFNGDRPSHPELLDWLANAFGEPGASAPGETWSLKRLHRLILLSSTYRQSGQFNPKASAEDSDNRLLWRFSPRRLEGEAVRDAMLSISGQLNPQMFGPGFRPFTITIANSHFYNLFDSEKPEFNRRTVYRINVNSGKSPFLDSLDCPDPSVKTPARGITTTPLQALALMNNSFSQRQAKHFAERIRQLGGEDVSSQAIWAYRLALGRLPTSGESDRAVVFLREHGTQSLCWVLMNSNEFLFVK